MKELDRIKKNQNGEAPKGEKTIIRVSNVDNAEEALANCKQIVTAFLENQSLANDSDQWRTLFPKVLVDFLDAMTEEDFMNDELIYPLESCIEELKNPRVRLWEWYSSKPLLGGFEITTTKSFLPAFFWMIHCQGIPYSKMWIMDDRFGHYAPATIKDVTTYK